LKHKERKIEESTESDAKSHSCDFPIKPPSQTKRHILNLDSLGVNSRSWIPTKTQNGISLICSVNNNNRNDALRKHGILPEKPPDPNDEFEETLQRVVKEAEDNRLENLNLNELDELEDEEDEDFLESYRSSPIPVLSYCWRFVVVYRADGRQKRMQEIREFNSAARYGTVEPLTKPDFVKQVTEQSDSVWVFVHLFKD
jgi:hypothetical protein